MFKLKYPITEDELLCEWDKYICEIKNNTAYREDERLFYLLCYPPFIMDTSRLLKFIDFHKPIRKLVKERSEEHYKKYFMRKYATQDKVIKKYENNWGIVLHRPAPPWKVLEPNEPPCHISSGISEEILAISTQKLERGYNASIWLKDGDGSLVSIKEGMYKALASKNIRLSDGKDLTGRKKGKPLNEYGLKHAWYFWQNNYSHEAIDEKVYHEKEMSSDKLSDIYKLVDPNNISSSWRSWRNNMGKQKKLNNPKFIYPKKVHFLSK